MIFSYILRVRDFDADYIGRYKDQKAYSYFDRGFVDSIHEPPGKNVVFIYSTVEASQCVSTHHKLWILAAKEPVQILTSWCDHVIATLYKIDYANRKGYIDPACTSLPCNWNNVSKKIIEPKRISEIVVRKQLRSQIDKKGEEEDSEGIQGWLLNEYDPRQMHHRIVSDDSVTDFHRRLFCLSAFPRKIMTFLEKSTHRILPMMYWKRFRITQLMKKCHTSCKVYQQHQGTPMKWNGERGGKSDNDLWITARQGRLTASNHHDIFTKMNSVTRARSAIKPYTTPLVSNIFKGCKVLSQVKAVSCGRDHESVTMKAFHVAEAIKHRDYQLQNCVLYIDHKKTYIAASPDRFFMCKCHGSAVIEIKCPFFLPSRKTTVSFSKLHKSITHRSPHKWH